MKSSPSSGEQSETATDTNVLVFLADALAKQHPDYAAKRLTTQSFTAEDGQQVTVSRLDHPDYGDHLSVETPLLPNTVHLRVTGGADWQRTPVTALTPAQSDALTDQLVAVSMPGILGHQELHSNQTK